MNAHNQVETMMQNLDLVDFWREINPELKRYTWRRGTPFQQSRLDYFLVTDAVSRYVTDADIKPGYRTDHSIITLTLQFGDEEKRNMFWKFNTSLLKDIDYLTEVNNEIDQVIKEYAAFPYNRETLHELPLADISFTISDQLFLDVLLMKIRAKTISYATWKKRKYQEKENNLQKHIEELEEKVNLSSEETILLENEKQELIKIRDFRMKGVLLRSRARWVDDGEKVSAYFCALEKRNYVNKCMNKLILNDGFELLNKDDIRCEVKRFYEQLYTEKKVEECDIFDLVDTLPVLSVKEADELEGDITLKEASYVLKNMCNGKSPGSDGFPAEFFKVFWQQLGIFVVRSLNDGFRRGELSNTQKEGIIICIPKPDRSRDHLKNWRPISLLNVVYKIGSACIANRIKTVLPSLINEDQTGFIRNRFIGDNVRLIYDVIQTLSTLNEPGLLICCDFEKAFDSLDWSFLHKTLQAFGFGQGVCQWVHTFYCNIKSAVSVNGSVSNWFTVTRGCRQGDPISSYLFVLCVEILGIMIRENSQIKGINLGGVEHKISQYADDTEILLEGDKTSFEETINTIEYFGRVSGLFLNTNKTSAIWLGSKRNSPVKYMQHLSIEWNPEKFKILGIWFTNNLKDCVDINFKDKFAEIQNLYKVWLKRKITPLGRVAILKSLILSKLTYLWILLPNPPDHVINSIQKSVFEFVWGRKHDRISKKTTVKNILQGGLGIPNIRKYIIALKLTWIKKLFLSNHKWKSIICSLFPRAEHLHCLGSFPHTRVKNLNTFWKNVFDAYADFGQRIDIITPSQFLSEPIFCNHNILVDKKCIFFESWFNNGVRFVKDLVHPDGQFFTFREFKIKYNIRDNFLTYSGCISAIKLCMRKFKIVFTDNTSLDESVLYTSLLSVPKGAKRYYDILIKNNERPNCCAKWEERLQQNIDWDTVFTKICNLKEVKMKWFQIRIVHRILATNVILHSMKVAPDDLCSFCGEEKDSIQHIFVTCRYVLTFWESLKDALCEFGIVNVDLNLTDMLILLGYDPTCKITSTLEYVLTVAKYYIYKCKCEKLLPNVSVFRRYLKTKYEVEKFIACKNFNIDTFSKMWADWMIFVGTVIM